MKFLEFKILDSIPILDEVHELHVLVNGLRDLRWFYPRLFKWENYLPLGMTTGRIFFAYKKTSQ